MKKKIVPCVDKPSPMKDLFSSNCLGLADFKRAWDVGLYLKKQILSAYMEYYHKTKH